MGEKRAEVRRAPAASQSMARTRGVPPVPLSADWIQRVGNRNLGRLISTIPIQRKCEACERETETNRVPDHRIMQRKCASCEEEEEKEHLLTKANGERSSLVPPNVDEALGSPGEQLDKGTRHFMESRFGQDFSGVQIHADAAAARSARALNAQAYTVGNHIVFADGRYLPRTEVGRGLIAHELTHVVQQQNGFKAETSTAEDQAEREASSNETSIHSGEPLRFAARPTRVAKKDDSKTETKAPSGPPGCTPEQSQKIDPAARLAMQWLDRAIEKLSGFVRAPGTRENQPIGEALQQHFGSTDPSIARRVLERIRTIRHDIDAARGGTELQTECHDKTDRVCDTGDAYVGGDLLVFCPKFFTDDLETRAGALVHEMAHSIVSDIEDRGYSGDRILVPIDQHNILSTEEQLTNAESYARLVQELATGKRPKLTAPEDSFAKNCKVMEPLLKVAIARAQRWNRAGETRIDNMDGAVIRQHLGADTPQIRKKAYDFYHHAHEGFRQSFEFQCERDCGSRLVYGKPEADNLLKGIGIGTGVGAAVGAVAGAIAGAFLGAPGLGALAGLGIGLVVGYFTGLIAGAVTSHGPQIHVCPQWKDQKDEPSRIESILVAAYEALGNSSADSLQYAKLARVISDRFFPIPTLQQIDRDFLNRRLAVVRARLATLREQYLHSSDDFAASIAEERQRESLERGTRELNKEVRSESANKDLWGGSFANRAIRRAATAVVSGNTATVRANIQITYLALSDREGRDHAKLDIPRIEEAIKSIWQVHIEAGDYAGMAFQLVPSVVYLPHGTQRARDAFLIEVRGPDKDPSSGDSVHGTISLAPAHLQGGRVIVVAHELAHLFGFMDTYATETLKEKGGKTTEKMTVGRPDLANRADLLGLIDPVVLERERKKGAVTADQVARQTQPVRVWEDEASTVLRTLGVLPVQPRPNPDSENFDPQVELDRIKREGESKIEQIRKRRQRTKDSVKSVDLAEDIIRLEQEERDLNAQLSKP